MKKFFHFPKFSEAFPNEKRPSKLLREYFRYSFRKVWCSTQCIQLTNYLNNSPLWAELFNQNLYRVNTLLDTYCDKTFNKKQRLKAIKENFTRFENLFRIHFCNQLVTQQEVCIAKLSDELNLYLSINQIDPLEGFFSLNIKNNQKEHIYDASFTLLEENKILISSIQGPNSKSAQDLIKSATKQLYGIRPMFMLIYIFKLIAEKFNLELLGIPHKRQAKYRWNDHSRLLFNYDIFWKDNNAILTKNDYWSLSNNIERKPLNTIPSKKRSMYKKRYQLLDDIKEKINLMFY
ncbi:VirK/YbjX family protein [Actinobacillus pleuropneumoniae]|uniref:VirK/YbjX family protein n=1 Tax=Actinobacillus pleuropneumoniae TaxID=715 RepID=UPI0001E49BFB|nr:VirK/YbjX family protein [Actinobacillus pleuropneumoniae]EFM96938.1 Coproporphyrinogen III oxidase [Actinobacillus pleuropneumoniae serovar 10 str. D13039]MBT9318470.1 VirK/YbjX family protein [Actinobacillus pleuropneumoniae]MBT9343307.1 VirK/YbjX family protein [Actinobacillus pleuropneumoniae]UKH32260.1 DUF535 domain-containing protein [Actinobacillus pleuropneumoniae serovar 10 str. D13039]